MPAPTEVSDCVRNGFGTPNGLSTLLILIFFGCFAFVSLFVWEFF